MKISLKICLNGKFRKPGYYKMIFDKYVRFEPDSFTIKNRIRPWDAKIHYKFFEKYDSEEILSVANHSNENFVTFLVENDYSYRFVELVQDASHLVISNSEVEALLNYHDLISCFLCNEDYDTIQSIVHGNELDRMEFTPEIWASIKNTPTKPGFFTGVDYLPKFNPGSSLNLEIMDLHVSWKMWFGALFFNYVPKEKIISFPYAYKIEELPGGIVFVQLYEDIETPYTADNVFKQWKWKEWIGFDELEEKYGL